VSKKENKNKKTHYSIVCVVAFDWKKMDMNSACTWSNVVKANPFSFNI
jgi:hypothetical protein